MSARDGAVSITDKFGEPVMGKCQGGPERSLGLIGWQKCMHTATWKAPFRSVFPGSLHCDFHAWELCDQREPYVAEKDVWGEFSWRRLPV